MKGQYLDEGLDGSRDGCSVLTIELILETTSKSCMRSLMSWARFSAICLSTLLLAAVVVAEFVFVRLACKYHTINTKKQISKYLISDIRILSNHQNMKTTKSYLFGNASQDAARLAHHPSQSPCARSLHHLHVDIKYQKMPKDGIKRGH